MTEQQLNGLISLIEAKMRRTRLESGARHYRDIASEAAELLEFEARKIKELLESVK